LDAAHTSDKLSKHETGRR